MYLYNVFYKTEIESERKKIQSWFKANELFFFFLLFTMFTVKTNFYLSDSEVHIEYLEGLLGNKT